MAPAQEAGPLEASPGRAADLTRIRPVPVVVIVLYLRKPHDPKSTPRDSLAMKGKAETERLLGVLPNETFDDLIRDDAADQSSEERPERD